uniref:SKP1-like protein n=1 Tax=Oryza punctata TaxID=4537 RepID=A0A0E0L6Z7_ORYPU
MAAAEEKKNKMIKVISSDGEPLEMTEAAASLSRILLHMMEDDCADDGAGITLPNVAAKPLAKVIEYCTKHAAAEAEGNSSTAAAAAAVDEEKELKKFDGEFIDVDTDMLYDLIMAANFMGVEGLLNLAAQRTAELIKDKSPEQIRETFGIKNDLTPEEEEEIRKEYEWAFSSLDSCSSPMAAAEEKKNKMIKVISSDGEPFEMTEAAASLSQILLHMMEDDCADDGAGITLPNVAAKPLAKVIDYCTKHAAAAAADGGSTSMAEAELKRFDEKFIDVDTDTLYHLLLAGNFMGVEGLLELATKRTAELIKGKSPEEIRDTFNIVNDFTPEEEEEIRKENAWVFQ